MTLSRSTSPSTSHRLYTRFINILKILQYFGYFIVIVFTLISISFLLGPAPPGVTSTLSPVLIVVALLQVAAACLVVFLVTQGLIATIDLLSRIEYNTRTSLEASSTVGPPASNSEP